MSRLPKQSNQTIFLSEKSQAMSSLQPCKLQYQSNFLSNPSKLTNPSKIQSNFAAESIKRRRKLSIRLCSAKGEHKKTERQSFLTLEEAGLVEISGLSTHERFLCRLTISSLNLLRVISEQEGCTIEELNAGRICDWFLKDKLKREQDLGSAVLQWDDSEIQF